MTDYSPGAPRTFMQRRRVGVKIQSDGTQTVLLLLFFPPFFVLSLAGPNSLQSAPAEAVQNLWNKASLQLRRRENPCGMRDDIPKEQILYFYPRGLALVPLGAVSPSEIHLLQGASAPTMGNKS